MKFTMAALACACSAFLPLAAMADGCDAITAAVAKGINTPHAAVQILTGKNLQMTGDNVITGGKFYTRDDGGAWEVTSWDPQKKEADYRSLADKQTCTAEGTEFLNGESVDAILKHSNLTGGAIDTRYWISQSSGLIVKDVRETKFTTMATTFTYTDIKPPVE